MQIVSDAIKFPKSLKEYFDNDPEYLEELKPYMRGGELAGDIPAQTEVKEIELRLDHVVCAIVRPDTEPSFTAIRNPPKRKPDVFELRINDDLAYAIVNGCEVVNRLRLLRNASELATFLNIAS